MAARASYIAGFAGTATVLAEKMFDIPIYCTMAHSFIQAFDDETVAFAVRGVHLDGGDMGTLSRSVRRILDDGGLADAIIFASGGLDEDALARFAREGAPIDGFGIGTSLTTSSDAPALDCAYKLQEYAGLARRKRSAGKATWPGRKQVWRRYGADGRTVGDVLSVEDDQHPSESLLAMHCLDRFGHGATRPNDDCADAANAGSR